MATFNNTSSTTNKQDGTAYTQQNENSDNYDDIFMDLESDDSDENELMEDVDFENIYPLEKETGQLDIICETDEVTNNGNQTLVQMKPLEEKDQQVLSQKFNQLSTTITNEEHSMMKDINDEIEKISNYLTKRNKSFQQMLHEALSTIALTTLNKNNNNTRELREITILLNRIMIIQTFHRLWTVYLKSGTGQLINQSKKQLTYPTNLPIWPKEIKTILKSTKMNEKNENEICMKFIKHHLYELDRQLKQYHTELNIRTNNIHGYTLTIQKMIETYLEENISSLRMEINYKIELVHYDYHIRALNLEYLRLNPNDYQKQLMKQLCQEKYDQEITEQEYNLLNAQIAYYNSPSQSYDCSPISHSTLVTSIRYPDIRQQVYNQFKNIAEQSKANMFTLYTTTARSQMDECKQKFDGTLKKMWRDRDLSTENETIPMDMIHLIEQRYHIISERIQCIYKHKHQTTLLPMSKA